MSFNENFRALIFSRFSAELSAQGTISTSDAEGGKLFLDRRVKGCFGQNRNKYLGCPVWFLDLLLFPSPVDGVYQYSGHVLYISCVYVCLSHVESGQRQEKALQCASDRQCEKMDVFVSQKTTDIISDYM